ncbi:hypothetical protein CALVIDRAFT_538931 [Calocera viscosa TUFC12733]|uniref:F-box domain-containing protein n=1 Tax=Calocera viscosa (strain TUFC12733) TaxID=1330018 RepID=A0A167KBJ0_CALVF|nr:hypothetical protein CALVIDRAFT_538931 [Calocera viscosa TUFC12733]
MRALLITPEPRKTTTRPYPSMDLSAELWYMIFELVEEDWVEDRTEKCGHPMLPLLLVCKDWKDIAISLLYRSLILNENASLSQMVRVLSSRRLVEDRVGNSIRHVMLGDNFYSLDNDTRDIMCILARAPRLVSLQGIKGSYRELDLLAITCSGTLRELQFANDKAEPIAPALQVLHHFSSLRSLEFAAEEDLTAPDDLGGLLPLDLPVLRSLSVDIMMAPTVLIYFSRCRFLALKELHVSDLYEEELSILHDFLSYHGPKLEHLGFNCASEEAFPKNMFPNLQHLTFGDRSDLDDPWPMQEWYSAIPASVRHLHLRTIWVTEPEDHLPYIDLLHRHRQSIPFKFIHLDHVDFVWRKLYLEKHSVYAGDWVKFALRLEEELGIVVLDKNGRKWTLRRPD